jgi:hypothetical protein
MKSFRQMVPIYIFCLLLTGADLLMFKYDWCFGLPHHTGKQADLIRWVISGAMGALLVWQVWKFRAGKK